MTKSELNPIDDTLTERGKRYGRFEFNAALSQQIKTLMRTHLSGNWAQLSPVQQEALDQIACKLSRIFSGDVNYIDNWHDIAGYARLAEEDIRERTAEHRTDVTHVNPGTFYPPL